MKLLLSAIAGSLLFVAACQARNVVAVWDQPETDETGISWNIYRKTGACASSNPFVKINTSAIGAKTYTDPSVAFGTFSYQVTAQAIVNGTAFESGPSNCADVTVTPSSPTDLQLTMTLQTAAILDSDCGPLLASYHEAANQADPFEGAPRKLGKACLVVAGIPDRP